MRELLAVYGTWYVIALGAFAFGVMMMAPEGLWGCLARATGWHLFPTILRLRR